MREVVKDYKEMCVKPQRMWMKKHWKGYVLMNIIAYAGLAGFVFKDYIKESIEHHKSQKEES